MAPADPAEAPRIIEVADGLCVRQEIDNIAWIDLGGFAVAIDALERPELEAEVFAAIRRTLGGTPLRYVLNTHTHYDHTALNEAFRREFGAEVVNESVAPAGPEGRWFQGTRRRLLWLPMPGCHTEEDCIAWVPADRALFVGDIFGWGLIPLTRNLSAETAELLLDTYQRLIDLDPLVMVPGHGPLGDKATLERWVEYFRWLVAQCRDGVAAGKSDREIAESIAPPDDMRGWWRLVLWKHADSVPKVLKAVRKGWLR